MTLFGFGNGLGIANKFVEAHRDSLAEVHGAMLFAGRDAQEPMTVAEVSIRKPALFGTEEQSDAAAGQMLLHDARGLFEPANGVLRLATANSGGTDHKGAIRDGFGDRFEFSGAGKQRFRADGGTRFAERKFVRVHDAKMQKAEIAHSACGGPDIEGIARLDEDDAQMIEFGTGSQGSEFTAEKKR
jgi:hypothetical protein